MQIEHLKELLKYQYSSRADAQGYSVDCWGYVQAYYQLVLGIEVSDYLSVYDETSPYAPIDATLEQAAADGWRKVETPAIHDVGIYQWSDLRTHAVICTRVNPTLMAIHVPINMRARQERVDIGSWSQRLVGWFRHPKLVGDNHA